MSNQYTIAKDQGIGPGDPDWPKQAETRREHPEDVRALMRASAAARYLHSLIENDQVETTHRISASKIILDKTVASLSSVDQTVRDETAENPEQIEAKLRMLIERADPALLSRLLGERASQVTDNYPKAVNQDLESSN